MQRPRLLLLFGQNERFLREPEGRLEQRGDGGLQRRRNGDVRPQPEHAAALPDHGQGGRTRVHDGMFGRRKTTLDSYISYTVSAAGFSSVQTVRTNSAPQI